MAKGKKVARKAAKPVGRVSPRAPGKKVLRRVSAARVRKLNPAPLMQLATAFWAFGTLAAAVELDLFSKICGRGTNADELMTLLGLPLRPAEVLLSGCAGLGLLQKRDGRFHNTPLADEYLVRGKPYYFGGFVAMNFQQSYLPWHPWWRHSKLIAASGSRTKLAIGPKPSRRMPSGSVSSPKRCIA